MERVGEHPIPAGPLAVRWLGYDLPDFRAGAESAVEVVLQNAGTATWRLRGELGVRLSYHWLDDRGNAIVWDGPRVDFGGPVAPGDEIEVALRVRAPQPPGRYRLAFDLVEDDAVATAHLVAGAIPETDWSRRILDAHAEGFAAVGGSIESRERALRPWAPGGGRNPAFSHPLLLPSLLAGLEPAEHEGLPAYVPNGEPTIFDGRIRLRLPRGRRRG